MPAAAAIQQVSAAGRRSELTASCPDGRAILHVNSNGSLAILVFAELHVTGITLHCECFLVCRLFVRMDKSQHEWAWTR